MPVQSDDKPCDVIVGSHRLRGLLGVPPDATGLVIFAHGSGSGRLSPRNNQVAAALRQNGMATLLVDLLTQQEEANRANVFDITLLAQRLASCADWVRQQPGLRNLAIGYFGASTGAAAALVAAARDRLELAARRHAIRGGRGRRLRLRGRSEAEPGEGEGGDQAQAGKERAGFRIML